jgi:hypothetical protein
MRAALGPSNDEWLPGPDLGYEQLPQRAARRSRPGASQPIVHSTSIARALEIFQPYPFAVRRLFVAVVIVAVSIVCLFYSLLPTNIFPLTTMSNVHDLFSSKKDDSDDEKDENNRYVGGIGEHGGGRCVLV